MTRATIAILLASILLVPTATAAPWSRDEPVSFVVPHPREGDTLAYTAQETIPRQRSAEAGDVEFVSQVTTRILRFEGPSSAMDRFGVERATTSMRLDTVLDGELVSAVRCHRGADSRDWVRFDHLVAPVETAEFSYGMLLGEGQAERNTTLRAKFGGHCMTGRLAGRTLTEGMTLTLDELDPSVRTPELFDLVSFPARATEFEGRRALSFDFDAVAYAAAHPRTIQPTDDSVIRFVMAEGLSELVHRELRLGTDPDLWALVGASEGDGPRVPPGGDEILPERNEAATFTEEDPLALDEAALELRVPFAQAYEAILNDPASAFRLWLADHPDAVLMHASFVGDFGLTSAQSIGPKPAGFWSMFFTDANEARSFWVETTEGASLPTGDAFLPVRVHRVTDFGESSATPLIPPARMDGASLAALLAAQGIDPGSIGGVSYFGYPAPGGAQATLMVSQLSFFRTEDGEGLTAIIDLDTGSILELRETVVTASTRSTIDALAQPPQIEAARPVSALARLTAPVGTPAVAAASATSLALLALLLKFLLLPLFTRLRRDRLLDNPVRARLYDRVRAEPGIHLAELEEFLGVGKGATKHHVDQLTAHKLVFVLDVDGYARCYASGHVPLDVARRTAVLRAGSHARVFELYAARPTLTLREAAKELGMSAPSIHRAKKRLEKEGLLPAAPEATVRAH